MLLQAVCLRCQQNLQATQAFYCQPPPLLSERCFCKMKAPCSGFMFIAVIVVCTLSGMVANLPLLAQQPRHIIMLDGEPVPTEDFEYLYTKNYQNSEERYTPESLQEYLELFINFKLKVKEARSRDYHKDPAYLKEFETYRAQLAQPWLTDQRVLDSLVAKTWKRSASEVRASHILLNVPPGASPADTLAAWRKLLDIRARALAGEDFAALAREHSEDPSAAQNGGDLGYFTALQMVYEFENAAWQTPPGQVSMPFRTRFGYHIVKVNDRRPSQGKVKVAHILVRDRKGSEAESSNAAARAREAYQKLQQGTRWNEICQQYSEDASSRDKNGELSWFGAGNMLPEFATAAFAIGEKGDISEPVKTVYGWHIIKLLDRKAPETFEEARADLEKRVKRDGRATVAVEAFLRKARHEFGFNENTPLVLEVLQAIDERLLQGKWGPQPGKTVEGTLFTIAEQAVDAGQFYSWVAKKQQPVTGKNSLQYATELYNGFVNELLTKKAEEALPAKHPEYTHLVREYREGLLLFKIMEEEVWNPAMQDTIGLKHFFEQRREDYQWKPRARATILSAADPAELDTAIKLLSKEYFEITAPASFVLRFERGSNKWGEANTAEVLERLQAMQKDTSLLLQLTVARTRKEPAGLNAQRQQKVEAMLKSRNIELARMLPVKTAEVIKRKKNSEGPDGGEITIALLKRNGKGNSGSIGRAKLEAGLFERQAHPAFSVVPFKEGTHRAENDGLFYYLDVVEVLPQMPMKLDEARGTVISHYQNYLEEQWLLQLKEKYEVNINRQELQRLASKQK